MNQVWQSGWTPHLLPLSGHLYKSSFQNGKVQTTQCHDTDSLSVIVQDAGKIVTWPNGQEVLAGKAPVSTFISRCYNPTQTSLLSVSAFPGRYSSIAQFGPLQPSYELANVAIQSRLPYTLLWLSLMPVCTMNLPCPAHCSPLSTPDLAHINANRCYRSVRSGVLITPVLVLTSWSLP